MGGNYFNTYKMSYGVCSWVVGRAEDVEGGFKEVRLEIILLDELNV